MVTNLLPFLLFLALQLYCRIRLSFQFLFLFSFRLPCYIVEQHRLNTWPVLVERLSFLRTSILKNKQSINYFVLPSFYIEGDTQYYWWQCFFKNKYGTGTYNFDSGRSARLYRGTLARHADHRRRI
jgi:hypothetical protein